MFHRSEVSRGQTDGLPVIEDGKEPFGHGIRRLLEYRTLVAEDARRLAVRSESAAADCAPDSVDALVLERRRLFGQRSERAGFISVAGKGYTDGNVAQTHFIEKQLHGLSPGVEVTHAQQAHALNGARLGIALDMPDAVVRAVDKLLSEACRGRAVIVAGPFERIVAASGRQERRQDETGDILVDFHKSAILGLDQ